VNFLLKTWDVSGIDPETQALLLNFAFPPELAKPLISMVRDAKDPRAVFVRTQLMYVAKQAVLHCAEDALDPLTLPNWGGLGIVFLMANDHLHFGLVTPEGAPGDVLKVLTELLPVSEYSGLHGFEHKVARSYRMLNVIGPTLRQDPAFVDIERDFHELTGLTPLMFQALSYGLLTKYLLMDIPSYLKDPRPFYLPNDYLRATAVPAESIRNFLSLVTTSPEELQKSFGRRDFGPTDFTWFRDRPLVQAGERSFPLDAAFLAEKVDSGVFWTLHNSYKSNQQKQRLHQFFGLVFQKYVNDLLGVTASTEKNMVVRSPHFATDGNEACDAIVLCGSSAILLEYKGATFTAEAKYGGVPEKLADEIEEKLKNGQQLATAIIRLFGRETRDCCREVDLSAVRTVYPLLVTRDDVGSALVMNRYLAWRFRQAFNRSMVKPRVVTPLFCMSVDALEKIAPYLGKVKLSDILDARYQGDKALNSTFVAVPNAAVEGFGKQKNEFILGSLKDFSSDVERLLFPEGDPGKRKPPADLA